MFAMMLIQRPLNMKARRGLHMTFSMSMAEMRKLHMEIMSEMNKFQDKMEEFQERINEVLETFPRCLFLIFRSEMKMYDVLYQKI